MARRATRWSTPAACSNAAGISCRSSLLRFDERARVLRVKIDKDVANRYPDFDRDEFQTMSEEDRRGYETRLLQFFPPDNGVPREPEAPSLPDWLLSGTWITVPPQRAEQLPAEARSFVNEFVPIHGEDVPLASERLVARDRDVGRSVDAERESDAAAGGQAAVGNRRGSAFDGSTFGVRSDTTSNFRR